MDKRGKNQLQDKNPRWAGTVSKESLIKDYSDGLSMSEIAKKEGMSTTSIFRRLKWAKVPTDPLRRKNGAQCHLWKGGVIKRGRYTAIKTPDHPNKNCGGYVREHILVMEKYLGRYLKKGEVIHHIDGDESNNRIENLMLFANSSKHLKYHAEQRKKCQTHNKEAA